MDEDKRPVDTTAAQAYETHMVPGMFAHWTQFAVRLADPRPGENVLDVACGTGIGARMVADSVGHGGRLAGLDVDPGVIAYARGLARDGRAAIEWHCASALKMPFADGVSHFSSLESFMAGMTVGSPSTRHAVGLLPGGGRERFVQEVGTALEPYRANGELQYPMRTHVLIARP